MSVAQIQMPSLAPVSVQVKKYILGTDSYGVDVRRQWPMLNVTSGQMLAPLQLDGCHAKAGGGQHEPYPLPIRS